ncbi:MAG: YdeI/OmpD-associated family protein [Bacteroidota bacterium]
MHTPDPLACKSFASPEDLYNWLEEHHATEDELWIKIFKKHTKIPSVSWKEVVIESLCWGWIDGIKKSVDDQAYLQRITPRRTRSKWSKINTQHVERLIQEGRMQEAGLAQVRAAKADGRWADAYKPASKLEVPKDFVEALGHRPQAKLFFDSLPKSSKYVIAYGLSSAKKAETRHRRFDKFMDMLVREEKPK